MAPQKKSPQKPKQESLWPVLLASVGFIIGVYLILSALKNTPSQPPQDPQDVEQTRAEKTEAYKKQIGQRINKARTIAEHRLIMDGQAQKYQSYPLPKDYRDSLDGLPLDYEQPDFANRGTGTKVSDQFPDHNIAYDLQDDQNAAFWEEEARRMFLRKYLLNARAQGYDLAIDQDYNVIVRKAPNQVAGRRSPQNVTELKPLPMIRFRPPFFLPPPYCH